MLRVLLFTFLGLSSSGSGFYLGYLYLESLNSAGQPLLLIPCLPLIFIGILLLFRASKANDLLLVNDDPSPIVPVNNFDNFKGIFQKNNQMVNEWIKESEKSDKLKVLEIAAAAEEEVKKNLANNN